MIILSFKTKIHEQSNLRVTVITRYYNQYRFDSPQVNRDLSLREKCPNTEFFLDRIFFYSD